MTTGRWCSAAFAVRSGAVDATQYASPPCGRWRGLNLARAPAPRGRHSLYICIAVASMTVGRKPKPSHLRLLDGNAGRRPPNDQEPMPVGELRDPPDWMTESQKDGWRYAIASAPVGLLKCLDRSVLVVWVVAEDLHREAAAKVSEYGAVIKSPAGLPMQSPYVGIMNKQAAIMMKAAAEMGFTPSSRSRVRVGETPSAGNRFANLRELGDD